MDGQGCAEYGVCQHCSCYSHGKCGWKEKFASWTVQANKDKAEFLEEEILMFLADTMKCVDDVEFII